MVLPAEVEFAKDIYYCFVAKSKVFTSILLLNFYLKICKLVTTFQVFVSNIGFSHGQFDN
ncbi:MULTISPECIES: hypothetical protein [unclassified Candidatus Tisiphia]|uniref:hypothetical protein n=1 Tax=unclassified Candidatus Tisiphia TaxID=2996318 RepID=UPI00312CA082